MIKRLVSRRTIAWLVFLSFAVPAGADLAPYQRPTSSPALAASGMIYMFIPSTHAPSSWEETQLDRLRLRKRDNPLDEVSDEASFILSALHGTEMQEFLMQDTEGPLPDPAENPLEGMLIGSLRVEGALASVGLDLAEVAPGEQTPWFVTATAEAFFEVYHAVLRAAFALRAFLGHEPGPNDRDEDPQAERGYLPSSFQNPFKVGKAAEVEPGLTYQFRRRVARSAFKIALGICLGLLVWGFVRNR